MLFYLNAKEFEKVFLVNESDKDILKTQYVLISTRIRTSGRYDNILLRNNFYPVSEVIINSDNEEQLKSYYFSQLKENIVELALFVQYSLVEEGNVVFMCSTKESRVHYLYYLAKYIENKFKYPVYNYTDYALKLVKLKKYNEVEVYKKIQNILNKSKKESKKQQKILNKYKKESLKENE